MSPNREEGEKGVMGMTREEREIALYCLKASSDYHSEVCEECVKYPNCDHTMQDDVTETIIKALEQEPCDDCINRKALTDTTICEGISCNECSFNTCEDGQSGCLLNERVNKLPSVTPQPKMGKWIKKYAEDGCGERYSYWACSECGRDVGFNLANIEDVLSEYPYCHCGAKMVEPQKSEVKK